MRKIKIYTWLLPSTVIALFSACKPDEDIKVETENYKGVIVVNEGGYGKSNGSVGLYKPGTGDYFDAFSQANGRPLGDIVQSIAEINGKYYIVVNNSNKIEVVNKNDFKSLATISVNQPRYVLQVSTNKAYISQMGGTLISVLDINSNTISKTIPVHAGTENMALMNGKVYAGKSFGNKIYIIDDTSDILLDSIQVGKGLNSIVNIGADLIGAICSGEPPTENGQIVFISKDSMKIQKKIDFTSGSYMATMVYNGGDLFYNLGDSKLYVIGASDIVPASTASITLPGSGSVYGFSIQPSNGDIYISDAGDFNSAGKVYIYNSNYSFVRQFNAGIAPGKILFNN